MIGFLNITIMELQCLHCGLVLKIAQTPVGMAKRPALCLWCQMNGWCHPHDWFALLNCQKERISLIMVFMKSYGMWRFWGRTWGLTRVRRGGAEPKVTQSFHQWLCLNLTVWSEKLHVLIPAQNTSSRPVVIRHTTIRWEFCLKANRSRIAGSKASPLGDIAFIPLIFRHHLFT